jgi:hypothetical protein
MLLQKTERARIELRPGLRALSLRERTLLLLCDGNKSLMDLRSMFDGEAEQIVLDLVRQGYLEPVTGGLQRRAPLPTTPSAYAPAAGPAADGFKGNRLPPPETVG